jgi:acyl-CoA reductase-like NAD-dependent aldehyde dehydrogenase
MPAVGGIKCVGYGKELASLGIEEFVDRKSIFVPNISS